MTIFNLTEKQRKFWLNIMENNQTRKILTRTLYSPIPLNEIADYIKWEIKKIKEEFKNGKEDTEKES